MEPASSSKPRLFVVHAAEDAWFVDGFLLPALGLPDGEVLVSGKLDPGAEIAGEIERGALSPVTRTGLAVTMARRADDAIDELSPSRRDIARRILLRLVQFGDGAAATRRQQTRAALATAGDAPAEIDAVIHHLADRRLITTSGGDDADRSARIDLAHEVLLTAWPALGDWIRSRRQDEQRRRALEARAADGSRAAADRRGCSTPTSCARRAAG